MIGVTKDVIRRSLPRAHLTWKQLTTENGVFLFTSDNIREKYTLWRKLDDGYEMIGTGKNPPILEKKFEKEIYG